MTKKRLLIVDDKQTVRLLLAEILSLEGYAVDLAEHGKHALQMLRRNSYDLIITDVNMPEMDGISFYRAIKEELPELKDRVLFLTGNPTDEAISFFKENSCKYMAKPFNGLDLLEQIEDIIKRAGRKSKIHL
ncbi:MAG TPA: response regulator [Thermodesulfobacteriota bacterium]|nr:response regulator [Thermodesulfobacteriota bacterium]